MLLKAGTDTFKTVTIYDFIFNEIHKPLDLIY